MECAECISTGQLCFDCQLRAAREEGRRDALVELQNAQLRAHGMGQKDGYAAAMAQMPPESIASDAFLAGHHRGYAACTADLEAYYRKMSARSGVDIRSLSVSMISLLNSLEGGGHVGAAGKEKL